MTSDDSLQKLRAIIVGTSPELAAAKCRLLNAGWDCIALDLDDRLIFKFPRDAGAGDALVAEARLLDSVRPAVTMTVPQMTIHDGPPLFSRHAKIPGEHLLADGYERLSTEDRLHLAGTMALFYAELHALDHDVMRGAGAKPIRPWLAAEDILRHTAHVLPPGLRRYAERTVGAWADLPADPHGTVFGFFDGHGWNMAFDHGRRRLNGIYDFGDAGFGSRHQEFIYSNLIAADLTERILSAYEALTGLHLDRTRIHLLTGVLRLSELAEYAHDPRHAPLMIRMVADWARKEPQESTAGPGPGR